MSLIYNSSHKGIYKYVIQWICSLLWKLFRLAASIAAEEDGILTDNATVSTAGNLCEDHGGEDEEMILVSLYMYHLEH